MEEKTTIRTFQDLRVYQNLYSAMKIVLTQIIPNLPKEEKYDLVDQMRRCCKACPALLAEGFAKRYQKINWQKYLNDTIGEANEMIHHLSVCIDIYSESRSICPACFLRDDEFSRQYNCLKNFRDVLIGSSVKNLKNCCCVADVL